MENFENFIAEIKRLSNIDYCESAEDLQYALVKINDRLNKEFPNIAEAEE
jgi:hypothetical protein